MFPFSSNRLLRRSPTADRNKLIDDEEEEQTGFKNLVKQYQSNVFATLKTSTNDDIPEDIDNEDNSDAGSGDLRVQLQKDSDADTENEYNPTKEKMYHKLVQWGANSTSIFAMTKGGAEG